MVLVYLTSHGSPEHFYSNTLTKFSNFLPHPMYPEKSGARFYVRPRSLLLHKKVEKHPSDPPYINVRLGQLLPAIGNIAYNQCLARVHFPPPSKKLDNGYYAVYEFHESPFFRLRELPLHKLSVHITDSVNEDLHLKDGPPTILVLEVKEMDEANMFTVTCVSNYANNQLFPSNTYTDFKAQLPQDLSLPGWEVAVHSIVFPDNIKVEAFANIKMKLINSEDNLIGNTDFEVNVSLGKRASLPGLITKINKTIKENSLWKHVISFAYNVKSGVVSLKFIKPLRHFRAVIEFNDVFLSVAGADDSTERIKIFEGDEDFYFPQRGSLQNYTPEGVGMVYCSIIKPNTVNDRLLKLMQILPVHSYVGGGGLRQKHLKTIYEPKEKIFHPVQEHPFKEIEFKIVKIDGSPHLWETADPDHGLIVTLLFRPIREHR